MLCGEVAAGPALLLQLGRLILRTRTDPPAPHTAPHAAPHAANNAHKHTQQPHSQQPSDEDARLEASLNAHIQAFSAHQTSFCIEVVLGPSCAECFAAMSREEVVARGLLLERWTISPVSDKSESPSVISSPWLLNAVRSQLHFSQLSAWRARRTPRQQERRRKLSRERFKKQDWDGEGCGGSLRVVYGVRGERTDARAFARPHSDHTFPLTDAGNNTYLKVVVESLPRLEEIPAVQCACTGDPPPSGADDLAGRLGDLSIGSRKYEGAINSNIGTPSRRNSIISNPNTTTDYLLDKLPDDRLLGDKLLDDRMHVTCKENGKHKCNCDDESDNKPETSKLDERRIKEIAKYKRKIRKEKMKICDSTSSEGERKETTSIPILQASRFDRFRAIGCYRNQTYLTLPASRIETKSPFKDTDYTPPEVKKTNTIATQTDFTCPCGNVIEVSQKCDNCKGMVRSEGNYNLASLGARRKLDDDGEKSLKKHKCDNNLSNFNDGIIKRPKLRRLYPIVDRLERIVSDRNRNTEKDMKDLHLNTDDSVFSTPKDKEKHDNDDVVKTYHVESKLNTESKINSVESKMHLNSDKSLHSNKGTETKLVTESKLTLNEESTQLNCGSKLHNKLNSEIKLNRDGYFESKKENGYTDMNGERTESRNPFSEDNRKVTKRQKTFSINDDEFITYEKCDYGTIDRHEAEIESPVEELPDFKFSNPEQNELQAEDNLESLKDGFQFPCPDGSPTREGARVRLPDTPTPDTKRQSFSFEGVKEDTSISPPASPPPPPPPRALRPRRNTGLLGSFEESALQGRLAAARVVAGFTASLGASGPAPGPAAGRPALCPPHRRLPVTVTFYSPGGTAAPYMGHISLGPGGYLLPRCGSVQLSLFNPAGSLVKMFCVRYDLRRMPPRATTFLRQRTLYVPREGAAGASGGPGAGAGPACLRYLIHLRFMTSACGQLSLHSDIRVLVSRKADLDTATALRAPPAPSPRAPSPLSPDPSPLSPLAGDAGYELRSFTYAPDNPRYSPR